MIMYNLQKCVQKWFNTFVKRSFQIAIGIDSTRIKTQHQHDTEMQHYTSEYQSARK